MIEQLNKRILEISIKHKLSHLGSCFTALPIIYDIYKNYFKEGDRFVLSSGHAGLALYVVLEHFYKHVDAENLLLKHGIHPERDVENELFVSTGSLGLGITIATGIAYAMKGTDRKCFVLISDGECAEGSVWESLAFINEYKISNIEVHCNINGVSAYKEVDSVWLSHRLHAFLPSIKRHYTNVNNVIQFENDLKAHYEMANDKMVLKQNKFKNEIN
jgi:transketolase